MGGSLEDGLFEDLPEHPCPESRGTGRPRLRRAERCRIELRALSLDDLVAADHRVRLVWAFAEKLDLGPLYAAIEAVEGRPGHPPGDPRVLMSVWSYATTEGVGSARALAKLCREHVAFQWLCGGVGMKHETLSDFRLGHGALLERLLIDSFAALLNAGIARLDRVAQDGVRVRASAGAASFPEHPTMRGGSTLKECRRQAAAAVVRLAAESEDDPAAASRREAAARQGRERKATAGSPKIPAANDAIPAANDAIEETKREARASTTDPEAKVMKMADGGFRPADTVQFAADTRSGAVAGVSVDPGYRWTRGIGGQCRLGHGKDGAEERRPRGRLRPAAKRAPGRRRLCQTRRSRDCQSARKPDPRAASNFDPLNEAHSSGCLTASEP